VCWKARWAMGRSDWHGLWAGFKLDANCSHKMAKKRNFNTLIILYMYIPQIPIKIFPKKAGYAREYPGTTVGPSMLVGTNHACFLLPKVDLLDYILQRRNMCSKRMTTYSRRQ